MMIRAIIFDLGEVLTRQMSGVEYVIAKFVAEDPVLIKKAINTHPMKDFFLGQITEAEYWDQVIRDHLWECDLYALVQAMRENIVEVPGTRVVIESLKAQGYILGLLSIIGKEWAEYSQLHFEYADYFRVVHYSFETRFLKPDPVGFRLISMRLQIPPQSCLFIDDKQRNVEGAKSVGMQAIQFIDAKRLVRDLDKFGIKVVL